MAETTQPLKARVALLLAVRNQADLLHHALSSLLTQSHGNFSLTVVDDGSDDRTPEVLASFKDPRLQVITTRPMGLIPSLNLAMQKCKPAAFYAVVYASCFYTYNFLETMLRELMRHPGSSGIFCSFCEGNAQAMGAKFQEPAFDNNELLVRNFLGPGVVFRGEYFRQSGGLFLSERKGIWETWQRLASYGPFVKHPLLLLRWTWHPYESSPPPPPLEPEKDLFPHLKVRILLLSGDKVDATLLLLLRNAGHELATADKLKDRPQLVLCGSPQLLSEALAQAWTHYAPVMLVLNEPQTVQGMLDEPRQRFLLGSCTIATRTLKIAQLLKGYHHQALVYLHGMTPRETNRLLTRMPMLLYRHRTVLMIRAYGSSRGLAKTIQALQGMNRPPEFGDLIIYCLDQHPDLMKWVKSHNVTWQVASQNAYFPELLFLLRQLKASYVLSVDAGYIPASDFFTRLWPLLADPAVGLASGYLNQGPGAQRLPLAAKDPNQLMKLWSRYKPDRAYDAVDYLSDTSFLIRKQVLEWALEAFPDTLPLGDEILFSRLLKRAGYHCVLSRKTLTFNLLHSL
ncbi:MAG: glycosyltransferase [Candidatus Sericytochromatia bacterium]